MGIYVIKANGKKEVFNPEKIMRTLRRSNTDPKTAESIIRQVEKNLYDEISTREVYDMVLTFLDEMEPRTACQYSLRQAIMKLGPAGFPFETYLAQILQEYGYTTTLRSKIKGKCVIHEIDIIAISGDENRARSLIEVKFRNSPGNYADLKESLYTYSRYLDLNNNGHDFDDVWLACNTKASKDAIKYCKCMGIKLLCWKYPKDKGLEKLIEERSLYPITALRSLKKEDLNKFSKAELMMARDLLKYDFNYIKSKTRLPNRKINMLIEEARLLCD